MRWSLCMEPRSERHPSRATVPPSANLRRQAGAAEQPGLLAAGVVAFARWTKRAIMLEYVKRQYKIFLQDVRRLWQNRVTLLFQCLNLSLIILSALMIWKGLMVLTASESPVVVVLSGSMEPAFSRGDVLFLNNRAKPVALPSAGDGVGARRASGVDPISVGDIVVFKLEEREIPIVHRVLEVRERGVKVAETTEAANEGGLVAGGQQEEMNVDYLTKGDANMVNDIGLYNGKRFLQRSDIVGRAVGVLRGIGLVTIYLNEYQYLKILLIVLMGVVVLTTKE